jgi:hypothetical protein
MQKLAHIWLKAHECVERYAAQADWRPLDPGVRERASWHTAAGRVEEYRPSVTSDGNDWVKLVRTPPMANQLPLGLIIHYNTNIHMEGF